MPRKKSDEMQPIYKMIGAKMQQLRCTLGWTQEEFAEKVGLDRCSIVNIENGNQRFPLHDVESFARAFNVTPKHFLRGIWF